MWVAIETYQQVGYNRCIAIADTYDEIKRKIKEYQTTSFPDDSEEDWRWERVVGGRAHCWYLDGGYEPSCIAIYNTDEHPVAT